ncbi:MAG TPA: hypothetical protein VIM36_02670, partial [Gemmatimonadaceae bacterium]
MPAPESILANIPRLVTNYYELEPDPGEAAQKVAFGTSGHRGTSTERSFNEKHILAITQAICLHRRQNGIDGPLFIGIDTHALSEPAFASALEVLAANGVDVMIDDRDSFTPTPVISHAILTHNRGKKSGLADGIVVTPSHNPPEDGGFKYNPPSGGPAESATTKWIQDKANELIAGGLKDVRRMSFAKAKSAATTHRHDYMHGYIDDLGSVIDFDAIRAAGLKLGVDPLGGAGVFYWDEIADRYKISLTVVSEVVDATFRFMTVDWDGRIRMDCSSPYAMQRLIHLKDRFDVAWACDPDHDRHGIVAKSAGLLNPNHYLSVAVSYLFTHRPNWPVTAAVGKTVVSSSMIDRVARGIGRALKEVPVGFKWFVDGLVTGSLGFGGEESA